MPRGGLHGVPLAALAFVVLSPAAQPARDPARPDVLLISVDTLRPDALGWVAGRNPTPALDTTPAARSGLRSRTTSARPARAPFFLFVHYYDAHDPYTPPARLLGTGPRGAYDGEVRFVDESVRELRRGLHDLRLDRNLLTIFLGDHGEALGEHGEE